MKNPRTWSLSNSQHGFSLIETMVAAGMAGIISLAVVGIMKSAAFFEKATHSKESVVANLARLGFELQLNLQQAIDITSDAATINAFNATPYLNDPGGGRIRAAYSSDLSFVPDGSNLVHTLAIFIAEFGSSMQTAVTPESRFRGVAIFFQHNEPLKSGAVYITTRSEQNGNATIDPDVNSSIFSGLVGFSIENTQIIDNSSPGQVTSVQFHATGRYFTGPNRAQLARWCNPTYMGNANCPDQIPYRDIERVYNIVLRNNRIPPRGTGVSGTRGTLPAPSTGLYGNLHFFNAIAHRGGDLY